MPVEVKCIQCGRLKLVRPALKQTKFCSIACKADWQREHRTGESHPRWTGGERKKQCQHCGKAFTLRKGQPITTFKNQKFCSKPCADVGGIRYSGPENGNWNGNPRKKQRDKNRQGTWSTAVISRDKAICQVCGAKGVQLHAHHIKEYRKHPELRWSIDNGLTVCAPCHWDIHSAPKANGVKSGKAVAGGAAGNPEPSSDRKVIEGVTTRGRPYRRVETTCAWCGTFISKPAAQALRPKNVFCCKPCAGKYNSRQRFHGSNASTSALPERDDIV